MLSGAYLESTTARILTTRTVVAYILGHTKDGLRSIEQFIGPIGREYLDHILCWNAQDLELTLMYFRQYYNRDRVHQSLGGETAAVVGGDLRRLRAKLSNYSWKSHCNGLFQTPIAA